MGWRGAHYNLHKLTQYVREQNLILSSACQLYPGALLRITPGSAASVCSLEGLGSLVVRWCYCFHVGRASEMVWDSITSHFSTSPLDWTPVTIHFLLHLWSPERAIRSTLSPPQGDIFPPHPDFNIYLMYNGCFLWMLSKLSFDSYSTALCTVNAEVNILTSDP